MLFIPDPPCVPPSPSQHALDLQLAVANILQLLVNSERNQQVLCEACLHQRMLQRCSQALADEDHPLHPPLQRMFERLASQALQPVVLRYQADLLSLTGTPSKGPNPINLALSIIKMPSKPLQMITLILNLRNKKTKC